MAQLLNIPSPCVCCGASGPNLEAICLEGTYLFPPTLVLTNTFDGHDPPCNSYAIPHVETFLLHDRGVHIGPPPGNFNYGHGWESDEITLPSPNDDWKFKITFGCFPSVCLNVQYADLPPFNTNLQLVYQITQYGASQMPGFLEPPGWKCTFRYMGFGTCGYLDSASPLVWRAGYSSFMGPPNAMFVTE